MNENAWPTFPVAIVDGERKSLRRLASILASSGITNILEIGDSPHALLEVVEGGAKIVILDWSRPGHCGEILTRLRVDHPNTHILILAGAGGADEAIECMKLGASDYLVKPVDERLLVRAVKRLIDQEALAEENVLLRKRMIPPPRLRQTAFDLIVGASEALDRVFRYTEAIAPTSHPVLITGETGVGKERFARALHELSGRRGEFVPLNAAGLDDSFFSDLLFGHRPGAFTGANTPLEGLIERARGGTLFLDEIGELSVSSQIKLLRTIELGEYYPLGSDALKLSSARFIVATNRDLERAMEEGAFRKDLFFRLRSHRLHIPPLRERLEDLPLLVEHFIARAAEELGKEAPLQSAELCSSLSAYPFLGNVRELESMVFEAVNADRKGVLTSIDFAHLLCSPRSGAEQRGSGLRFPDPLPSLREVSELLIDEALRRAKGNQAQAARLIGVSPQAISKRLAMRREKAQSDGSAARSSASKMGARRPQSEAQWRQKRLI